MMKIQKMKIEKKFYVKDTFLIDNLHRIHILYSYSFQHIDYETKN